MLSANNKLTKAQFIAQIGHPRKEEMAEMIFDGASYAELEEKGFGRVNVMEMVSKMKTYVEGMSDFRLEVPTDQSTTGKGAVANGLGEPDIRTKPPVAPEASTVDTGSSDSGSSESGPSESGPSESGSSDSGPSESGAVETNTQG